ncbi:3-hydroxyacyl-CoA dehydrogenase family protein [Haloarcula nitratireducens]|uniref:3-hydroxyacyl-CoA dehydrogenase family protein n=1 Tax=Haloarcula nitratireducens TaxID=2487749 RepID=A0AAW4P7N7_9EURY|nr:3-hydroxyacyl-CoA dehydrogenase family protein [Halomicroarcula nitratireducens]MBX0293763.1 3-hydroxyacyl-CoA dehydrogenase family protein [Halomicroarcula nitratireducens]
MNVAVLGAGTRGRDATRKCLRAGYDVRLYDSDAHAVMDSIDAVGQRLPERDISDHVDGTTGLQSAVSGTDVVLDTTAGDVDERRELLAEVEQFVDDEAIFVSETEESVTAVATGLERPGRAAGLHFVEPAESELVEVVLADQTTEAARERVSEFVEELGGVPLTVRDTPGFAAARLELAELVEAIRVVESGVATVPDADLAAARTESERGPLARADERGLDAVLESLDHLAPALDDRFEPPALLRRRVADGHLGESTGEGFYVWKNGEPSSPAELRSRTAAPGDDFDEG